MKQPREAFKAARQLVALLAGQGELGWTESLDERQSWYFVQLAVAHGVAAVAHDELTRSALGEKLAPCELERLTRLRLEATAQHLVTSADLRKLALALGGAGVPWAVMKGPAVAYLGYGDPTLRWSCDLDVLVHPSQFGEAIDALVDSGATLLDVNWELQLAMMRSEVSLRLPFGTLLDLHWHPVNDARARSCARLDLGSVLERRRAVPNNAGLPLLCLGRVDNMVFVALHAALSGGHRLVWSKDVQCLARRDPPEWEELADSARRSRVGPPVGAMLLRSARLLGAPIPPAALVGLLGGPYWSKALSAIERFASPVMFGGFMRSGKAFMSSLRGSPWQSAVAMAATASSHARAEWSHSHNKKHLRAGGSSAPSNPLRSARGGEGAKRSYLAAVAAEGRRS